MVSKVTSVRFGLERKRAQESEVVAHGLARKRSASRERVGKRSQNARRERNVLGLHVNVRSLREGGYNREEGLRRQERRLVGQGIKNLCTHTSTKIEKCAFRPFGATRRTVTKILCARVFEAFHMAVGQFLGLLVTEMQAGTFAIAPVLAGLAVADFGPAAVAHHLV